MDYVFPTRSSMCPRVLVVEDNPTQAILLMTLVQKFGLCPLGPVATAAEALHLYQATRPELAIIDIGFSGIDLVTRLRKLDNLPLLFLAGHPDLPGYEQMQIAQPLIFLPKPYHLEELRQAITQGISLANI